jgi:hypothetical protein
MRILKELLRVIFNLYKYKPSIYKGNFDELAKQIVQARWNGKYFEAGESPRLNQFWLRDFAFCLSGLMNMEFEQEVNKNLEWAINHYVKSKRVTTTISPTGYCFDFPKTSIDGIPFLLYSIKKLDRFDLIEKNKDFFNNQIQKYYDSSFDKKANLVKADKFFSQPKDVIMIKETCVENTFMIFTSKLLEEIDILENPFPPSERLINNFINAFWDKDHFRNDLTNEKEIIESSDSNIWPYWTGIIQDKKMLINSINWIESKNFLYPFPIKYHTQRLKKYENRFNKIFLQNYQGNSIWTMNAPIYFNLIRKLDEQKANKLTESYKELVTSWQDYYEVLDPENLKPLKGFWKFKSDKGMLWISMFYGV